jgi:hypothetical protein
MDTGVHPSVDNINRFTVLAVRSTVHFTYKARAGHLRIHARARQPHLPQVFYVLERGPTKKLPLYKEKKKGINQ